MEKKRILAIDDCREVAFAHVLCRTYNDGIKALETMGPWDELYLDHDLGAIRQDQLENGHDATGYDVLCFLEQNTHLLPKKIVLITSNPVGRQRMIQVMEKLYGTK